MFGEHEKVNLPCKQRIIMVLWLSPPLLLSSTGKNSTVDRG